ncbi:MAG: hypothetical protein JNK49_10580 [Planctomycetes bacterium]|nr:hypothetical protein [Planctomycetota bacterium]
MQRLLLTSLCCGLLGVAIAAQAAPAAAEAPPAPAPTERLQQLLRELRATDAAAWQARLGELEQRAKARDAEAVQWRTEAKALEQRAAAADAEAQALRSEQARLQELRQLLAHLPAGDEVATPPAKDTPAQAPAPEAPRPPAPMVEAVAPSPAPPVPAPAAAGDPAMVAPAPPAPVTPASPATAPAAPGKVAPPPTAAPAPTKEIPASELVHWARVAPLFQDHCASCHDPTDQKGGLDLSTFAATRAGGGSGQSVVPGAPDQSRLYRMVAQQERPFMPRNADPLGKEAVQLLRTWIEHGAAEDEAGARTFLAEQAAAAAANAATGEAAAASAVVPLPESVPKVPLRTPSRPGPVTSLVRSPCAPLLAWPGLQQLVFGDAELRPLAVVPCALPHCGPVAFAEDGSAALVTGGEPGRRGLAELRDVRSGALLATIGADRDVPLAAAVHRGAGLVAFGGSDKTARVRAIDGGAEVLVGKHEDFVLAVAFAPDGRWLAAGDRAGNVLVWETRGGSVFQTLAGHRGAVHAVAFDRRGKSLLTAGADGTVRLWDVEPGRERWRQNAHPNQQALAACFGPEGGVASCGSDGVIATFSATGAPGPRSSPVGEWLYAVAFGADDKVVFAGDWQGRVHRFDTASKALAASVLLAPATNSP